MPSQTHSPALRASFPQRILEFPASLADFAFEAGVWYEMSDSKNPPNMSAFTDSCSEPKVLGQVKKGEKVLALTGEVHSVPLRVTAKDDYPDAGVKAGDTLYILHYEGEGYWAAWHDGKVISIETFSGEARQPKATWWVKLKTRTGVIGWTVSHGNFGNQDACG